jgi:hypothetical protein
MNSQISKDIHVTKDGETKNHQAFAMEMSRLKKAKETCESTKNCGEFNRLGGENRLKEVEGLVKTAKDANYNEKKVGMDAGRENQFIKTHGKDRDNANPTAIGGIPKVNKGDISRKILSNKEVYNEQIEKEISNIKYLIEYMTNNKKQNL